MNKNKVIKALAWYTVIVTIISKLAMVGLLLTGEELVLTWSMLVISTILSVPILILAVLVIIRSRP